MLRSPPWDHDYHGQIILGWQGFLHCPSSPHIHRAEQVQRRALGRVQHLMWAKVSPLTTVITGLHKVADSLGILEPGHIDFQVLAEDCNRQLYLLDHLHLRGVDIQNESPQVRS